MRKIGPPKVGYEVWPRLVSKIRRNKIQSYTSSWSVISAKIIARDGHRCVECGSQKNLSVHHIIPISRGGSNAPLNLKTLCSVCHSKKPFHGHLFKKRVK